MSRRALAFLLWTGTLLAADPTVPMKCDRANAGLFWPEAANHDAAVLNQAARCGSLRYCGRTTFGWKWQSLTVSVQSLARTATGRKTPPQTTCPEPAPDNTSSR